MIASEVIALVKSLSLVRPKQIISIKEARKLLGDSSELSDEDVKVMIRDYEILARQAIREYMVRK